MGYSRNYRSTKQGHKQVLANRKKLQAKYSKEVSDKYKLSFSFKTVAVILIIGFVHLITFPPIHNSKPTELRSD